jgi:hypothetical protein
MIIYEPLRGKEANTQMSAPAEAKPKKEKKQKK